MHGRARSPIRRHRQRGGRPGAAHRRESTTAACITNPAVPEWYRLTDAEQASTALHSALVLDAVDRLEMQLSMSLPDLPTGPLGMPMHIRSAKSIVLTGTRELPNVYTPGTIIKRFTL